MKIKVAQFGLGPIGISTVKLLAQRDWAQVVGAVDIDPDKFGRDLDEFTKERRLSKRRIFNTADELLRVTKPDLIIHTAVSKFRDAYPDLKNIAGRGISVVSSCEELVFPQLREPALARKLDRLCVTSGARVLGTGVNPGFVMDVLPLCLTSMSANIESIHVERIVNASTRREPLQRKIGSGMEPRSFRRLLSAGKAGHAGLLESFALIAHALGWKLGTVTEKRAPVIAQRDIWTRYFFVKKGQCCGISQNAKAKVGNISLSLALKMYLDAEDPHDSIQVKGEPSLELRMKGGIAGDMATVAALVNSAQRLLTLPPGLRLMTDLPLPRFGGH